MTDIVDIDTARRRRRGSISLCMIVRDEAETIAATIGSARELVDEVIVVDTGSTDGTIAAARACGARVSRVDWTKDFAAARNASLDRASRDWILVLDADEELDAGGRKQIRAIVDGGEAGAYLLEQRTYTDDSATVGWRPCAGGRMARGALGFFSSRQVRLFRNDGRIRYSREVHETVEPSLRAAREPLHEGGAIVHHYGRTGPPGRIYRKYLLCRELGTGKLDADPENVKFVFELAVQFLALDRVDESLELADAGLAVEPDSWQFLNLRGLALLKRGDRAKALESFRAALNHEQNQPDLYNNRGVALLDSDRPAEALDCLGKGLALDDGNANLLRNAASACLALGRHEACLSHADRSLAIDPYSPEAHLLRAEALHGCGNDDEAAASLDSIRFLADTPFAVSFKAIHLFVRMGRAAPAAEALERIGRKHPAHEGLLFLEGKIREMNGDDEGALEAYERALASNPRRSEVLNSLGCVHERRGRFEEAEGAFEEAHRLSPQDPQIETNLGIVVGKRGRSGEAERRLREAIARHPRFAPALNALGCLLANGGRFAEATVFFTDAVENDPENGPYYLNLGLACEMLHLPGKAAEIYEQAIRRIPEAGLLVAPRLERLRQPAGRS
ncbi:MAG: tetratricopeptide repeat protein [Candidatus Krumholzibacteriota bacterium]|nr:tetratricopeptide repeat protein [Candidatus Krumholzibacteriota bacterium]